MSVSKVEQSYDRMSELKAFDDTKADVKGLVDSGITKVPQIFILPPKNRAEKCETNFTFPVIDLKGIDEDPIKHKEIVDKVRDVSETWGFFQVVNHGIPTFVLHKTLQGTRQFFEQDNESFCSSCKLERRIFCFMTPNPPGPQEFPTPCWEILMDYSKDVTKLGFSLVELLSEGLGLDRSYLKDYVDCFQLSYSCNYYPPCPQPELTMGTIQHTDVDFVTVLLQDDIGGLQVLHQNHWIDVPPTPGVLVVNLGDFLQLLSNGKYISVEHRAISNRDGSRMSVACFFIESHADKNRVTTINKKIMRKRNYKD
ncbi:hypothetical protein KY290_017635 [Solanum tuberosum]|uniref:Fe2OG dioxygenase domain-containing protein n=2 Tax=Solanum tuberosum TaxID=4113 RepID=A0ABQ7VBY3_SOLTU|nr:hypothetical protein KY285_016626 [Solanum tuberosum]KAH0761562.1 hypothetical protein KY290_017635 [Solanum tuberosum]